MTNDSVKYQLSISIIWTRGQDQIERAIVNGLGELTLTLSLKGGVDFKINGHQASWFVRSDIEDAKHNVNDDIQRWAYIDQFKIKDIS